MQTRSDERKLPEAIISFADLSQAHTILEEVLNGVEYAIEDELQIIDAYVVKFNSIEEMEQAVILLNSREDIVFAEPNYLIQGD